MTDNNARAITVHVTAKKSVTQYEPVEVGASFTYVMPDDATLDQMVVQQDAMYQALSAVVEEQVAALVDDMRQQEARRASHDLYGDPDFEGFDTPPEPQNELDKHFGPRQDAPQTAPDARSEAQEAGQVQYAPKAADRVPGQWWTVDVEQYALSGNKLDLYRTTSKFPDATMYESSPAWPGAWVDKMTPDGQRHDFAKPVRVKQEISAKQNSKGFYYVDVKDLTVLG